MKEIRVFLYFRFDWCLFEWFYLIYFNFILRFSLTFLLKTIKLLDYFTFFFLVILQCVCVLFFFYLIEPTSMRHKCFDVRLTSKSR